MKALIIYFSGTGNTDLITSETVSRLRRKGWDVEAVSIETLDAGSRDFNFHLRTMDLLGFGFPVYKFSYPEIMEQIFPFLLNLKPSDKPFFVFSTYCRFASTALHRFALKIENTQTADSQRAHTAVALREFKCPSNGISSLKDPGSRAYTDVMYFSPGIDRLLDDFADEILAGYALYAENGCGVRHRGSLNEVRRERLVGKIEKARYPRLTVDPGLCVGCGLCAKRCPEVNLIMEGKLAVPRDESDCLHCLRCLHICPKNAISFGPLVQGPMRYRPAVRRKLFAEAIEKTVGEPEPGTRPVKWRWAAGNIRYYLKKR